MVYLPFNGADVFLVSGPTHLITSHKNITRIDVTSASEMYHKCIKLFQETDGAVLSAAVADYTPANKSNIKIKSTSDKLSIELEATIDIAQELGRLKQQNQKLIGFALETNDEIDNARNKIKSKNFDFIVLNSLNDKGAGFSVDTNKITIIDNNNNIDNYELKTKKEVAKDIVNKLLNYY